MAKAANGDTVKVHYTVKLSDGTTVDSSSGSAPLEFKLGEGQLIQGFEEAVVGMEPGESSVTNIPPDKAYGPHHDELTLEVNRSELPPSIEPQIGQQLQLQKESGGAINVLITNVTEESVTLDANHPLAGEELTFEIELMEIG
jgi:FKBP-type peptidyl-prolyl cis-trans isomerase 2